jgi:tyrosyl-tRNA synthetase
MTRTSAAMTVQRTQRRRLSVARLERRSSAMDCYYTGVNIARPAVDEQLARIRRGAAEIIVDAELRTKLERSRQTAAPLKVKLGLDPTAPDLHLGHTVVLQKLRDFQDLGHQIIIIIGDFTGMIGDPTGRSETRRPLTWDEIRSNAETYKTQLGKVLDMSRAQVRFNSEWLGALTFEHVIRETAHLTVARILQREDFATRHAAGRPISLHEFLYPLAQGYDSVALGADVELGGTDQTFNLLVGRDLQRAHGQEPQVALTVPILEGLDGVQKMSKSLGNYVGITEPPADMYGKLMSVSDALMFRYFELVTRVPEREIAELRRLHPMEAKKRLARTVTAMYHGEAGAAAAEVAFARVVQAREVPDNIELIRLATPSSSEPAWKVVVLAGMAPSNSEARRLIQQGGVEVDGSRVTDPNQKIDVSGEGRLLQVGKRKFKRFVLEKE